MLEEKKMYDYDVNKRFVDLKKEIEILDDKISSIRAGVNSDLEKHLVVFVKELGEKTNEVFEKQKVQLEEEANQIFKKSNFIKKLELHLINIITDEVKVSVKNADLHKLVGDILKQSYNNNLEEIVKVIVQEVFNLLYKKNKYQLSVTKNLVFSIDSEIKHLAMRTGMSEREESFVREKVNEIGQKMIDNNIKFQMLE